MKFQISLVLGLMLSPMLVWAQEKQELVENQRKIISARHQDLSNVHVVWGVDRDYEFMDSLDVVQDPQEGLAVKLYTTHQSLDDAGELDPWVSVIAMLLPLENVKEIKVKQPVIKLVFEKEFIPEGEEPTFDLYFSVPGKDFAAVSEAFLNLQDLLQKPSAEGP